MLILAVQVTPRKQEEKTASLGPPSIQNPFYLR